MGGGGGVTAYTLRTSAHSIKSIKSRAHPKGEHCYCTPSSITGKENGGGERRQKHGEQELKQELKQELERQTSFLGSFFPFLFYFILFFHFQRKHYTVTELSHCTYLLSKHPPIEATGVLLDGVDLLDIFVSGCSCVSNHCLQRLFLKLCT